MSGEDFFSRWSRRKAQVRGSPAAHPAPDDEALQHAQRATVDVTPIQRRPADLPAATEPHPVPAAARAPDPPAPTMADVARLTPTSDYSRFVGAGVDPGVQRAALKKLFSDPHYNVMDGLDIYIDDYGKPDPMPASMLRRLAQSKTLGLFDAEPAGAAPPQGGAARLPASPDGAPATAGAADPHEPSAAGAASHDPPAPNGGGTPDLRSAAPAAASPPDASPDEDTALRLQPDDAAAPAGAGPHRPGARP